MRGSEDGSKFPLSKAAITSRTNKQNQHFFYKKEEINCKTNRSITGKEILETSVIGVLINILNSFHTKE